MNKKIVNGILITATIILFLICIVMIETRNDKIEKLTNELNSIERPSFQLRNESGVIWKYFNYGGVEFSSFVQADNYYGFSLIDFDSSTEMYCNLDTQECKIEIMDFVCMDEFDMGVNFNLTLNSINCIKMFNIKGEIERRIY